MQYNEPVLPDAEGNCSLCGAALLSKGLTMASMAQEAMTIGETETDWIREKLYDAAYEAVSGIENEHGITFTEAEREALIDKFREGFYQ